LRVSRRKWAASTQNGRAGFARTPVYFVIFISQIFIEGKVSVDKRGSGRRVQSSRTGGTAISPTRTVLAYSKPSRKGNLLHSQPLFACFSKMLGLRLRAYALLSVLASVACVAHAIHIRRQFYSVVIHLATSKISVTILGNMAFVTALCFAQLLRHLFLGSLRAAELDRLYEKTWFAITETCLALTIFREELR
jgi:hypothetical protein